LFRVEADDKLMSMIMKLVSIYILSDRENKFFDKLSEYQLFKKYPAPWSE
jgi:hypothetical protein